MFQPSKLAAASFGLGIGGFVGILVALLTGSFLGAAVQSSSLAPGAAAGFWLAAVMSPAAIVTGIVAKMPGVKAVVAAVRIAAGNRLN